MIDEYRALSRGCIRRKTCRGLNLLPQFSAGQVIAQRFSRIRNTEGKTFSARYCDMEVVWVYIRFGFISNFAKTRRSSERKTDRIEVAVADEVPGWTRHSIVAGMAVEANDTF